MSSHSGSTGKKKTGNETRISTDIKGGEKSICSGKNSVGQRNVQVRGCPNGSKKGSLISGTIHKNRRAKDPGGGGKGKGVLEI